MKKMITIPLTNHIQSKLIGVGPSSDYTGFTLNDDPTRGGFARPATSIAHRKAERHPQGPVLILDGGDCSMRTAFDADDRYTDGEDVRLRQAVPGIDMVTGSHTHSATVTGNGAAHEIKGWTAMMDHLRGLPVKITGELRLIKMDERAAEVPVIKARFIAGLAGTVTKPQNEDMSANVEKVK